MQSARKAVHDEAKVLVKSLVLGTRLSFSHLVNKAA